MPHFPIGRHMARVVDCQIGASTTGTVQMAISFADDAGNYGTWYGSFTPDALKHARRAICALGIEWHEKDDATVDIESWIGPEGTLVGREAQIVVEEEAGQDGNPRLRVRWVNRPSGGGLRNAMGADEVHQFAANFRRTAGTKREQAASSDIGGSYELDDIPFDYGFEPC